jgi:hypothetical protein
MNPPFKSGLIERFVGKLVDSFSSGDVQAAIMLTNNCTDAKWWHLAAQAATAVCFTLGRISFDKVEQAAPVNGQPRGQCFLYFGDDYDAFKQTFRQFGGKVVPLPQWCASAEQICSVACRLVEDDA